jgi:hypothetical protein
MAKTRVFLAIIAATWIGGCNSQPMAVTHDENGKQQSAPQVTPLTHALPVPPRSSVGGFDGTRAFEHVRHLVELGPRPPGSDAIHQAQSYVIEPLKGFGCHVEQRDVAACDIIDFDVRDTYWHTPQDTLDKVDPRSLAIVGHVFVEIGPALEKKSK